MNKHARKNAQPHEIITAVWLCLSTGILFIVLLTFMNYLF